MSLSLSAAGQVEGWMAWDELEWLEALAAEHSRIVEVGCWQGRSTKALAGGTRGVVYAVDNWAGERVRPLDDLEARFCANLADEIAAGKVRVVCRDSLDAARRFRGRADMVFIDGDHAPAPARDMEAWLARLAPGGFMCGHDRGVPGVAAALAAYDWQAGPGSMWSLR